MVDAPPGTTSLGRAVEGFDAALQAFRAQTAASPQWAAALWAGHDDWQDLLRYKLVPHLAGEGCLIVAVTGGTNSGKSTLFNLLLGRGVSPAEATAAATRQPLLAGNAQRVAQCLEGRLVPEFHPQRLERGGEVLEANADADVLFVVEHEALPDWLVLLDTPDIDSIEKRNWEVAEHLQALGDVLIAVVTGEKYRDDRVVRFYQRAVAAGRRIVPLMNKANPANDFAVARRQLETFCEGVKTDAPSFVLPHDFAVESDYGRPIPALDGAGDLRTYLQELDVAAIKREVYRDTVTRFATRAGAFLDHANALARQGHRIVSEVEALADRAAQAFEPVPGAEVGGLFHEFVQARRGRVRRVIGQASKSLALGAGAIGRRVRRALWQRAALERDEGPPTAAQLHGLHRQAVERIARELAARCVEFTEAAAEPAGPVLAQGRKAIDFDAAVERVSARMAREDNISDDFRRHAHQTIEMWWNESPARRRALESLDTVLAVVPSVIALPIALHTGGIGVSEAFVVTGPVAEQFVARIVEYRFGDRLFDFLSPWRAEQQQALRDAFTAELIDPLLAPLRAALAPFDGEALDTMKRWHAACRNAI